MKTILSLLLFCSAALSMERAQVACTVGGKPVVTNGVNSTTRVQASYPNCTITVYITGGVTLAAIFSDNLGTPLANPFAADSTGHGFFYAANGHYNVQISGGSPSLPAPYTFGDIDLFDFGWTLPSTAGTGCLVVNTPGVITFQPGCSPGGPNNSIQFNSAGSFGGNANFSYLAGVVFINNASSASSLIVNGITNLGTVVVNGNSYDSLAELRTTGGTSAGLVFSGYSVIPSPNTSLTNGGYMTLSPVLYNPYNSPTQCLDQWGNIVTQPLPLQGLSNFSLHDTVMWVSTSPVMPASGGCGSPIPVEGDYGLNINSYMFARGGFASDLQAFNTFQLFTGGAVAASFTAGGFYNAGTATHCCGTLGTPTFIGGYVAIGHSKSPPIADGNLKQTVAAYDNPLTWGDGLEQGTIYWDDTLACINVYNGTSWGCIGGGGTGTPGGPNTSIQFNNGGAFGGTNNLEWTGTVLGVTGTVQATVGFNSSGVANNTIQAPNGGVLGNELTATDSIFIIQQAVAPPLSAATQTRIYANSVSNNLQVSSNGGAYTALGAPAGSNTQVQFNNSGSFGASGNFLWGAGQLTITGVVQSSGGFNASVGGTATNIIQANTGGVTAKWLIALDSVFLTELAAPALAAAGQDRIYGDSTTHQAMISKNGAAYVRMATNSGTLTNGHCVSIDGSGNMVDAGGACTVGGGGGTVSSSTIGQVAYYTAATTVSGAGAMSWNNATQLLQVNALNASSAGIAVGTGFIQSDRGFLATNAVATQYNAFSAPSGGIGAINGTFTNYTQVGTYAAATATGPTATTSDTFHAGTLSWSTVGGCLAIYNGTSWGCFSGGGGGSPGGSNTNIQFNNGVGGFGGTSNFTWTTGTNAVLITGASTNSVNIGETYINSLLGGVAGKTMWALAYNGAVSIFKLADGTGTGGINGNGETVYATGNNGVLQAFDFKSAVVPGSSHSFENASGTFIVDGNGVVSANGVFTSGGVIGGFNVTGNNAFNSFQTIGGINIGVGGAGSGTYAINSGIVINSSSQFIGGGGINTAGAIASSSGLLLSGTASAVVGGSVTATGNINSAKHYSSSGTIPSIAGTGCSLSVGSTDAKGSFLCTGGTGALITFATAYASAPACVATGESAAGLVGVQGPATTGVGITYTVANHNVFYMCMQ